MHAHDAAGTPTPAKAKWLLGEIKPHVGARLPLAQVNEAFALIEGRGTTGKVVLEP